MKLSASTTLRVDREGLEAPVVVSAEHVIPASAYGDVPVRHAIEDQVLSRLLVSLPRSTRTIAVLERMRGRWAVDEIGHGAPGEPDYLAPRTVWIYRITVELEDSELLA